MRSFSILIAAALFCLLPAVSHAATPLATSTEAASTQPKPASGLSFNDTQKGEIEGIVKQYLTKDHPEVLMEAMQELQRRDQASAQAKSQKLITEMADKIYRDPASPVGGNPKGAVVMVEFFDYNCGYCKASESVVQQIVKENKDIKMIYKNYPILGPMSTVAAKISLAAAKQSTEGFVKFHEALMNKKDHLTTEDDIYKTAKSVGLDVAKLKKDSASDDVAAQVKDNLDLGMKIGVRGTPMFIVGSQVFPGAVPYDQLKDAVESARKDAKTTDK